MLVSNTLSVRKPLFVIAVTSLVVSLVLNIIPWIFPHVLNHTLDWPSFGLVLIASLILALLKYYPKKIEPPKTADIISSSLVVRFSLSRLPEGIPLYMAEYLQIEDIAMFRSTCRAFANTIFYKPAARSLGFEETGSPEIYEKFVKNFFNKVVPRVLKIIQGHKEFQGHRENFRNTVKEVIFLRQQSNVAIVQLFWSSSMNPEGHLYALQPIAKYILKSSIQGPPLRRPQNQDYALTVIKDAIRGNLTYSEYEDSDRIPHVQRHGDITGLLSVIQLMLKFAPLVNRRSKDRFYGNNTVLEVAESGGRLTYINLLKSHGATSSHLSADPDPDSD